MKVVILGSSGFIGGCLVRRLSGKPGLDVTGISSKECDLTNAQSVHKSLGSMDSSTALVFCSTISRTRDSSFDAFLKNVTMAGNVFDSITSGVPPFLVFLSSSDIYGLPPLQLPITEMTKPHPEDYYGLAKLTSEMILGRIKSAGAKLAILRLPGVYGYGDKYNSVVGGIIKRLTKHELLEVTGDGATLRDYVHVDDVCGVIENMLQNPRETLLNVATGRGISIRDIVSLVAKESNSRSIVRFSGKDSNRDADLAFDISQLSMDYPEIKFTSLEKGVKKYIRQVTECGE